MHFQPCPACSRLRSCKNWCAQCLSKLLFQAAAVAVQRAEFSYDYGDVDIKIPEIVVRAFARNDPCAFWQEEA